MTYNVHKTVTRQFALLRYDNYYFLIKTELVVRINRRGKTRLDVNKLPHNLLALLHYDDYWVRISCSWRGKN